MKYLFLFILFCLLLISVPSRAYNLHQISSKDGLSNSAILSMYQDREGYMWFGTCDGLNQYDGQNIRTYKTNENFNSLSGNFIFHLTETEDGIFWIYTDHGLNRLDKKRNTIDHFDQFHGAYFLCKSHTNDIFVIEKDNCIYYYQSSSHTFKKIVVPHLIFDQVLSFITDPSDKLWIFTKDGHHLCYQIERTPEITLNLTPDYKPFQTSPLLCCSAVDNEVYFLDNQYLLHRFNLTTHKKYYISDLSEVVKTKGEVSCIIRYKEDYLIGFRTNGLIYLKKGPNHYIPEEIEIKSGIFCFLRDKKQDIIWIGTDGNGVYTYSEASHSIQATELRYFTNKINKPIRAIFLDQEQTLWVGTKGDGILQIHNYQPFKDFSHNEIQHLTKENSTLSDNLVYAFTPSRKNLLWIGHEEGLSYYSYQEHKIKNPLIHQGAEKLKYIHQIYEASDTLLWLASSGMGMLRVRLTYANGNPVIKEVKSFTYQNGDMTSNFYFSLYAANDTTLWFANRGFGLFKMDMPTQTFTSYQLGKEKNKHTLNDVFSIFQEPHSSTLWLGTNYGLIRYTEDGNEKIFNESHGFPNGTIHDLLPGSAHSLWFSTNQGIIKFNTSDATFQAYDQRNGLTVTEFSDGAAYKDQKSDILFFGGINGFVTIHEENYTSSNYLPAIQFDNLTIFGEEVNIFEFLHDQNNQKTLRLNYDQNFFSLNITAIDYLNGNNYSYYYKLQEISGQWIDNGSSHILSFTNLSPGYYTLHTKYKNRITGQESPVYTVNIRILPPWYSSPRAYFIYILLSLIATGILIYALIRRHYQRKKQMLERIKQKYQAEAYESKLRFFTNIAHEFCTPLTLIYGPCNRILNHVGSDAFVLKYTQLIQHNAERLNNLIQELIEFRRIETGNRMPTIEKIAVSEMIQTEIASFCDLAESKGIQLSAQIPETIQWNSDKGFLRTAITNLISNAFKYTFEHGQVKVEVTPQTDILQISISNTGKGIKPEEIGQIFDHYHILNNFENPTGNKISRNGLGLAISYSMVKLLRGQIEIKSVPNGWTDFVITLPNLPLSTQVSEFNKPLPEFQIQKEKDVICELPHYEFDKFKSTLLVIDDEIEMLWFVSELFSKEYNVLTTNRAEEVDEILSHTLPNIILSDIMLPGLDGISLTRKIKENPQTAHIPLILISAKHTVEEQIEGLSAGAELYITKPFNIDYLKISVKHLLERKETLKDYFSSPISAYELEESKLTHKEDKKFVKDIYDIIYKHLDNKELSTKFIATELNMSIRTLYRKLSDLNELSPSDMIRECRLHVAKDLLLNTKTTIDEIIYKSGFANRSPFFKAFAEKFGCTPKEFRDKHMLDLKENG